MIANGCAWRLDHVDLVQKTRTFGLDQLTELREDFVGALVKVHDLQAVGSVADGSANGTDARRLLAAEPLAQLLIVGKPLSKRIPDCLVFASVLIGGTWQVRRVWGFRPIAPDGD